MKLLNQDEVFILQPQTSEQLKLLRQLAVESGFVDVMASDSVPASHSLPSCQSQNTDFLE